MDNPQSAGLVVTPLKTDRAKSGASFLLNIANGVLNIVGKICVWHSCANHEVVAVTHLALDDNSTGRICDSGARVNCFNVILKDAGSAKIQVIKVLRELTGLGLKEAKEMTDKPGVTVKEGVKKADADEMKVKLESAGAVVELK